MEKWTVNDHELSCTCPVEMKRGLCKHELGIQMIQRDFVCTCHHLQGQFPLVKEENVEDKKSFQGTYARVAY